MLIIDSARQPTSVKAKPSFRVEEAEAEAEAFGLKCKNHKANDEIAINNNNNK